MENISNGRSCVIERLCVLIGMVFCMKCKHRTECNPADVLCVSHGFYPFYLLDFFTDLAPVMEYKH